MITLAIKEVLELKTLPLGYYLYLYRDGETVFYVGKSANPLKRFTEHLRDNSPLASVIKANKPDSLNWTLVLFSLDECIPAVRKHMGFAYSFFLTTLEKMKPYGPIYEESVVSIAEEALIENYQPCLNIAGVGYVNNLPEKYRNTHVRPEDSSSMYLDL